MSGKVHDARLYHRVQEWAKTSGGIVTERDADAVVSWLRSLRGADYGRKPAEGLRRQVLKVISQMRAPASAPAAAGSAVEWTIDTQPDPAPADQPGQKRSMESASPVASKAARMAAAAAASSASTTTDVAPSRTEGGGFNLLNASIRAAMATPPGNETDGKPGEAVDSNNGQNGQGADGADGGQGGRQRPSKRERRAERRPGGGGNGAGGNGQGNGGGNGGTGGAPCEQGYAALGGMDEVLQQVRELVECVPSYLPTFLTFLPSY